MGTELLTDDLYKFTGPVEHWLTTFHTGFWGLREKHESTWEQIEPGDVFVLHAANPIHISASDAGGGIVGIGIVGKRGQKSEPVWYEELAGGDRYPYLIHFAEIHWFGAIDKIEDAPVAEKSDTQLEHEATLLSSNQLTFGEMDETGYRIPPMGSFAQIRQPEKVRPLLYNRLEQSTRVVYDEATVRDDEDDPAVASEDTVESPDTAATDGTSSSTQSADMSHSRRRERSRSRDRDPSKLDIDPEEVSVDLSRKEQQAATLRHEEILDIFEDALNRFDIKTWETDHSDLLGVTENTVILTEAKTISNGNERSQIRRALGQLLEYRYLDVRTADDLRDLECLPCLLLDQPPSAEYRPFLGNLQNDGIYTFWIQDESVKGFEEATSRFAKLIQGT